MAALMPSKALLSTPSALSAVLTRYGPSVPMSTALRTRFVPYLPIYLSRFMNAQPRIRIDLFITNLFLDLVAENIDVAIRFGELEDSSLVATRIGKSIGYVGEAAEYLKGRKPPV